MSGRVHNLHVSHPRCERGKGGDGITCLADMDVLSRDKQACAECAPYVEHARSLLAFMLRTGARVRPVRVVAQARATLRTVAVLTAGLAGACITIALRAHGAAQVGWWAAALPWALLSLLHALGAARGRD